MDGKGRVNEGGYRVPRAEQKSFFNSVAIPDSIARLHVIA